MREQPGLLIPPKSRDRELLFAAFIAHDALAQIYLKVDLLAVWQYVGCQYLTPARPAITSRMAASAHNAMPGSFSGSTHAFVERR